MGLARRRLGSLFTIASRLRRKPVIAFFRFPGTESGQGRRQQQGGEQTCQGLESGNDSRRGGRGSNTRFIDAWVPGTCLSPSIIRKRVLMRVGTRRLGAAARDRIVLVPAEDRSLDREMSIKEVLVPGILSRTPAAEQGGFLRAAILPQGLVETDDKPRQGRGVAKGEPGREPGHASIALVG